MRTSAFFVKAAAGQRLYLHHLPAGSECRGAVIYVHPFAEELNKSRRMAALQSRALASGGYTVVQLDLLGCGDSSGDFGDASWDDWVEDIVDAIKWTRQRHPTEPLWLWGLRAGCLLAREAADKIDMACNLLFWQPASAGSVLMQQFLRLKLAGHLLDGQAKAEMKALRAALAAGEVIEIAGYRLRPEMVKGFELASLSKPPGGPAFNKRRAVWLEVSSREGAVTSPAVNAAAVAWRQAGFDITTHVVSGLTFWQTNEIEEASALIDATLAAMAETVDA